jgi:high-affinity iron transporter
VWFLLIAVWWGVAVGGGGAILFGIIFTTLFYLARDNAFQGPNRAIFQGSVAWLAGIIITFLAFAMLRYKGWEDKIARKLEAKAQEVGHHLE